MGPGDSRGNGGSVDVEVTGSITTKGNDAVGIFAQSVGGGGGMAGQDATCVAPCSERVGSVGANGSAGPVTVNLNGAITTEGQYSHGIFAQSAAGSASPAGIVSVTIGTDSSSSVLVKGADADGILAQSVGGTNGAIKVSVDAGSIVQGGSGDASYGIHFLDGAANTLDNAGTITTLNGVDGVALRADGGTVAVTNSGSIVGAVDLNGTLGSSGPESITNSGQIVGNVQVHNQAGVIINGGSGNTFGRFSGGAITVVNGNLTFAGGNTALGDNVTVNSGAGAVTNNGRLLAVTPVAVTGNFDQSGTGHIDFLLSSSTDPTTYQLSVIGAASFAGGLGIDLASGFNLAAGDSFDLIGSDGLLSGGFSALSLDGVACSANGTDDWRCGGFLFDLSIMTGALGSVDLSIGSAGLGTGPGAVPEPSTWAMLALGFLGLGGLALRRGQSALAA
jgi:PEP-CTERM motif